MQSNWILVDSGPLIALFDKSDFKHKEVWAFLETVNYDFITTLAVTTEVFHMLKWSKLQQSGFLEWIINSGVYILPVTQEDLPEILRLTKKYSNLPMDFADATLVVAAEKTGIREIISIDSDFDVYRLPGKEKIHNIFNRY